MFISLLLSLLFSSVSDRLMVGSSGSFLGSSMFTSTSGLGLFGSVVVTLINSGLGVSTVGMPLPQHGDLHMLHLMLDFRHEHLVFEHLDCWTQVQQPTNLSLHLDLLGLGASLT